MTAKHHKKGRPHPNEERGIRRVVDGLPDSYHVFSNIELPTGRAGLTYEHDLVVVTPYAVFTIELKSYGGRIRGNRDTWTLEDGKPIRSPISLQTHKARVLKDQLRSRHHSLRHVWVQGLVYVTGLDARPEISRDFAEFVVHHDSVLDALLDSRRLSRSGAALSAEAHSAALAVLNDGRPADPDPRLGPYTLVERLLADDRDAQYEAWRAARNGLPRRLHLYRIKGGDTVHRGRLRDRAMREANLLERLRRGPHLVEYLDFDHVRTDHEEALVLNFTDDTHRRPLLDWLDAEERDLDARLDVARQLTEALRFVHDRDIVHRRLSPQAIRIDGARPDVRLGGFDLARDLTGATATLTASQLEDPGYRCAAPELLRTGEATRRSDRFALGAVLHTLFTDRQPFERPEDVFRPLDLPPLHLGTTRLPEHLDDAVRLLLDRDPFSRPELETVADWIASVRRAPVSVAPAPELPEKGRVINDLYAFEERIGEGAGGPVWRMRHVIDGIPLAAKLAPAGSDALDVETQALQAVQHPNLVRFHNRTRLGDQIVLLLEYIDGVDGRLQAAAGDPLDAQSLLALGEGLFGALDALHAAGWLHRDVKPDNVLLGADGPTLIDLGLAADRGSNTRLAVGSAAYKDPLLFERNRWQVADDLYAAWLTLYEIATGVHPFGGENRKGEAPDLDADALPDGLAPHTRQAIVAAVIAGLDPEPGERPATASAAVDRWRRAFAAAEPTPQALIPAEPAAARGAGPLPDGVTADTPLAELPISTRGQNALLRLGLAVAGQLVKLKPQTLRDVRGVGTKTAAELKSLADAAKARFGDDVKPDAPPPAPEPFYRPLIGDHRPLDVLIPAMGERIVNRLARTGLTTLGDLAGQPEALIANTRGLGASRVADLRRACARLGDDDTDRPDTLDALDALVRKTLGKTKYSRLVRFFGLHDDAPQTQTAIAEADGVTRAAANSAIKRAVGDLAPDTSPGEWLRSAVRDALPAAGVGPFAATAKALEARLPATRPDLSHRGYVRLGAALFAPEQRFDPSAISDTTAIMREPWTTNDARALRIALREAVRWPPSPREAVVDALARAIDDTILARMKARETDRDTLLDAARALDAAQGLADPVHATAAGTLYRLAEAIAGVDAMRAAGIEPSHGMRMASLMARIEAFYGPDAIHATKGHAIRPIEREALRAHLEARGLALDGDRIVDPDRLQAHAPTAVTLDIDTAPARRADGQFDVDRLVAAADGGGFRVAVLDLDRHHRDADALVAQLGAALGTERVRGLDLDRIVIRALQAADLWDEALFDDARPRPDWAIYRRTLRAGLDAALHGDGGPDASAARPGVVTVLTRPALLGHMQQTRWLDGLYEAARGGRYGLIVLALPGGIREGRLRLNEKHPIPYTPDMGALDLRRHRQPEPAR